MPISLQTYLKILLIVGGREVGITAFSIVDYVAKNPTVVLNVAAQYGAYVMGVLPSANDPVSKTTMFFPLIKNSILVPQFIGLPIAGTTPEERALGCLLTFSTGGIIAKVADLPPNAAMGAFIFYCRFFAIYGESDS